MDDAEHQAPAEETGSPAQQSMHVEHPILFSQFAASKRDSHDEVWMKAMRVKFGQRAMMRDDWNKQLDALKNQPLVPTNHGQVVGVVVKR